MLLSEQNKLQESGELLMFQLGFDSEAFGLVFASDYKTKVLAGEEGKATQATVEKFLEKVVSSCTDLSFSKDKMLREFLFTDSEITYEELRLRRTIESCLRFSTLEKMYFCFSSAYNSVRHEHIVNFLTTKAAGEVRGPDCEGCWQLVAFHSQFWQIHKVFYSRLVF